MIRNCLVALALIFLPEPAGAQEVTEPPLEEGGRIRVTVAGARPQTGTLISTTGGTLRWIPEASSGGPGTPLEAEIPLSTITRLEQSVGTEARYRKTILLTSGVLALAGGALFGLMEEPPDCSPYATSPCTGNRQVAFVKGFLVGGLLGVPTGAIVASNWRREVWNPVALGAPGLTTPTPRVGVFALGVSIPLGR